MATTIASGSNIGMAVHESFVVKVIVLIIFILLLYWTWKRIKALKGDKF